MGTFLLPVCGSFKAQMTNWKLGRKDQVLRSCHRRARGWRVGDKLVGGGGDMFVVWCDLTKNECEKLLKSRPFLHFAFA